MSIRKIFVPLLILIFAFVFINSATSESVFAEDDSTAIISLKSVTECAGTTNKPIVLYETSNSVLNNTNSVSNNTNSFNYRGVIRYNNSVNYNIQITLFYVDTYKEYQLEFSFDSLKDETGENTASVSLKKGDFWVVSKDAVFINSDKTPSRIKFSSSYKMTLKSKSQNRWETEVKAVEEEPAAKDSEMLKGASVRIGSEGNGMRFSALVNKSYVSEMTESGCDLSYGMIIMPFDYIEKYGELTAENLFGNEPVYDWETDGKYTGNKVRIINLSAALSEYDADETKYIFKGSILNVKTENLDRDFIGKGYIRIEKDGEVRYEMIDYADGDIANNKRSMIYVAEKAYASGDLSDEQKSLLKELYPQGNYD